MKAREIPGFLGEMAKLQRETVRGRMSRRSVSALELVALRKPPPPDFAAALRMPSRGKVRIIAEMKKASPSAGVIREAFEPLHLARRVVQAGASAVSVLTEERYFQGSLEDLARVAAGVPAPVMRKDFIVDTYQLLEARCAGAAACLLIAAMLDPPRLGRLLKDTADLGMAALVEVHDRRDLDETLDAGAEIVGINNRDLRTLKVDTAATFALRPLVPAGRVVVSESGHRTREDLVRLEEAGVDAVLVGEAIMRAEDVAARVRELLGETAPGAGGLAPGVG